MPFCSYNTLHRPKYMHKTRFREQLAQVSNDGDAVTGSEQYYMEHETPETLRDPHLG
jgi:hypothetical protein